MISEQPRYLSQGVNYLGFLAKQLGDLRGSKTLAHELIQNADDAKDDSGNLAATKITFDITDEALIVSNDAVFRETDFTRMKEVASGSKRNESGDRTTGAFGVGFISVYQITDRPEIHSAGRRWVLRPDEDENQRIQEWDDASITAEMGTLFKLPWAFKESKVRKELKAPAVDATYIESFIEDLKTALPKAILFLKKLERIELRRNGEIVSWVEVDRTIDSNEILIGCDQEYRLWRVFTGDFSNEAQNLRNGFAGHIDSKSIILCEGSSPRFIHKRWPAVRYAADGAVLRIAISYRRRLFSLQQTENPFCSVTLSTSGLSGIVLHYGQPRQQSRLI